MLGARVAVIRDGSDAGAACAVGWQLCVGERSARAGRPGRVGADNPDVQVRWPSGRIEEWPDVAIDRWTTLTEGTGK